MASDAALPDDTSRVRAWRERLNASRSGLALITLASFLESIIVPIPLEAVLVPFMLANRQRVWLIATLVTLGCLAGALIGYAVGYFVFDTAGSWLIETVGWGEQMERFRSMFNQYGFWAVIAVGVIPIPFQVAMLAAGAAGYPLPMFLLASGIARGIRYYGLAVLVLLFGRQAMRLWERHKLRASLIAVVVLVLLYLALSVLPKMAS